MLKICEGLVKELGGEETPIKICATHWVYFKDSIKTPSPAQTKVVNFRFITDCFFILSRINDEPYEMK